LRTPLNVIIGFSEMLQDELIGKLNEKQAKYVDNIRESGLELQRLITNIVDVFKIDAGKVPLETTVFSLREVIESAFETFESMSRDKNISFSIKMAPEVSRICADPQKLATIFENLLSNALKFTPQDGTIEVGAERSGDWVRICIADSGSGLSPEDCKRVFTEFYKVADPQASAYAGSGLGLAITKKLVLMHGGDIWAESEKGQGTKFIFTLSNRREKDE
jgi:signal transduction histidine kinase